MMGIGAEFVEAFWSIAKAGCGRLKSRLVCVDGLLVVSNKMEK
jgi:hypothetical protein